MVENNGMDQKKKDEISHDEWEIYSFDMAMNGK